MSVLCDLNISLRIRVRMEVVVDTSALIFLAQ
jgi:hypothetical protein